MKTLELETTVRDMKNAFNRDTRSLHIAKERNKEKSWCGEKKKAEQNIKELWNSQTV